LAISGSSRCAEHTQKQKRLYESERRERGGTTKQRGYAGDWPRLRLQAFVRDEWRCRQCGWEPNVVRECRLAGVDAPPADVIQRELAANLARGEPYLIGDHIKPSRGDSAKHHDLDNVQTLCDRCHGHKSSLERQGITRGGPTEGPGEDPTGRATELPGPRAR
jgi:5-methylcytosine-specific restriction endonuclease McrA